MLVELWDKFKEKEKINDELSNKLGTKYNSQNYLEQMSHVCDDVDKLLKKSKLNKQDILALVLYTSWSFEAVEQIKVELNKTFNLTLDTSDKYKELDKFNKAIRSFVIAHPLNTTHGEHNFLNLNGQYVCLDVYLTFPKLIIKAPIKYFTFTELKDTYEENKQYVYFKVYNTCKNNENPTYQKYFGLCIDDLITCIKVCLEMLDTFNMSISQSR